MTGPDRTEWEAELKEIYDEYVEDLEPEIFDVFRIPDDQNPICGERLTRDGELLVPLSMRRDGRVCEYQARYVVSGADADHALLVCGVHEDAGREKWKVRCRDDDSTEQPAVEPLKSME